MDLERCWKKAEFHRPRLVATDLIETAKRRCHLNDFGEGDFFEGLSRLLESCQDEARLNLIGKIALKTDVLETLSARLKWNGTGSCIPNIARQEIREPILSWGCPVAAPASCIACSLQTRSIDVR
jgi:hypothetical protein